MFAALKAHRQKAGADDSEIKLAVSTQRGLAAAKSTTACLSRRSSGLRGGLARHKHEAPLHEIAEHVNQILVHALGEAANGEIDARSFGRVGDQCQRPTICWKLFHTPSVKTPRWRLVENLPPS